MQGVPNSDNYNKLQKHKTSFFRCLLASKEALFLLLSTLYKVCGTGFREQGFRVEGGLTIPLCAIGPSVINIVGAQSR